MQIEIMKLADLKPADYNPRIELTLGMDKYDKLKQSIIMLKEFEQYNFFLIYCD